MTLSLPNFIKCYAPLIVICSSDSYKCSHFFRLYSVARKTSGFGDYPDLISEETPPSAVLDIVSDSDLLLPETSLGTDFIEGEETETMVVPPLTRSRETSSTTVAVTEPIPDENGTLCKSKCFI